MKIGCEEVCFNMTDFVKTESAEFCSYIATTKNYRYGFHLNNGTTIEDVVNFATIEFKYQYTTFNNVPYKHYQVFKNNNYVGVLNVHEVVK